MLRLYFVTVFLSISIIISVNAEFPTDTKPCKYEQYECIKNLIDYYLNERNGGDNSLNLVKIDPLKVPKMSIKQGGNNPVNIDLKFTDNDIYGMKSATTLKVKGFGKDITGKHAILLKMKIVSFIGDYKINGKILILPISGTGKSNITLVNPEMGLSFYGKPYEKDGAIYMQPDRAKLILKPERMFYKFDNLFNGDKELGDNMNAFLNENWKDIYSEVRDSLVAEVAEIFANVVKQVFSKYPYEKFFIQ